MWVRIRVCVCVYENMAHLARVRDIQFTEKHILFDDERINHSKIF